MRILTGYMPATAGKAVIAGFDIFDQPIEAKRRIGYLPENNPLYPEMLVTEYLDFVARLRELHGTARRTALDEAIAATGLEPVVHRPIGELSK